MGMKTSGAVFQRIMNQVMTGILNIFVEVYIDNITIFSLDFETHMRHLAEVFQRLREANLKVNLDKCNFARKQVKVLGHIVSERGITPNPEWVEAIMKIQQLGDLEALRNFMRMVGFYRKFIPHCSTIGRTLYLLTGKHVRY